MQKGVQIDLKAGIYAWAAIYIGRGSSSITPFVGGTENELEEGNGFSSSQEKNSPSCRMRTTTAEFDFVSPRQPRIRFGRAGELRNYGAAALNRPRPLLGPPQGTCAESMRSPGPTRRTGMNDDKQDRGEPDRSRISLGEDYEVRYWTERLGVTKEQLAVAVRKVGNSANAVRQALGK
jgi:uncharacterized protein DUF3606